MHTVTKILSQITTSVLDAVNTPIKEHEQKRVESVKAVLAQLKLVKREMSKEAVASEAYTNFVKLLDEHEKLLKEKFSTEVKTLVTGAVKSIDVSTLKVVKAKKTKEELEAEAAKPKKPLIAYMRYLNDVRDIEHTNNPDLSMIDLTKRIASNWNVLPDDKKSPYLTAYAEDKAKYDELMKEFSTEDGDVPETHVPFPIEVPETKTKGKGKKVTETKVSETPVPAPETKVSETPASVPETKVSETKTKGKGKKGTEQVVAETSVPAPPVPEVPATEVPVPEVKETKPKKSVADKPKKEKTPKA